MMDRLHAKTGKSCAGMSLRQIELALRKYTELEEEAIKGRARRLKGRGGLEPSAVRAKARRQVLAERRKEAADETERVHRDWAVQYLAGARHELFHATEEAKKEDEEVREYLV